MEHYLQGAINIVKPAEQMVDETIDQLLEIVENVSESGSTNIVIDLSEVPFMSGKALEFLLDTRDQFNMRGGQVKLASPILLVEDMLRITNVSEQFLSLIHI